MSLFFCFQVVFGERSLKSAEAMQNLATTLDALGHHREAEQLLTTALDVVEEVRMFSAASLTTPAANLTAHFCLRSCGVETMSRTA